MNVLLAIALQAAAKPPQLPPMTAEHSLPAVAQKTLDDITDACHAPRRWLKLRGREVVFKGNPGGDATQIECVLNRISTLVDAGAPASLGDAQVSDNR